MPTRLLLLLAAAACPLAAAGRAAASPITYAFAGTTDPKGEGTFSGTFTIDGDPATNRDGSVTEAGDDVSITLNLAGETYHFSNQGPAWQPTSKAEFHVGTSPSGPWLGVPQDEITLEGANYDATGNGITRVGITFYAPTAAQDRSDLRTLDFDLGTGSIALARDGGGYDDLERNWEFTSVELVPTPTPEPGTLAVFAALGAAALWRRGRS